MSRQKRRLVAVWTALAIAVVAGAGCSDDARVRRRLENGNRRSDQADEAIEKYSRLIQRDPKSAELRYQRAVAFLSQRQTGKALADLREALRLAPDFAPAILALAELQIRYGRAAQAAESLEGFVARLPDERPERRPASLLLAIAYRAQHAPAKAEAIYRRMLEKEPLAAQLHHLLGLALLEQDRKEEAIRSLDRAFEINPKDTAALAQVVTIYLREGKNDAAQQRARKQVAAAPDSAVSHYLLGTVYTAQQDWANAEKSFLRVTELEPFEAGGYAALGRLYSATGKEKEALARFEKAIKSSPRAIPSLMSAGFLCQKLKDNAKACEYYERVLALKPDFTVAANNLASIYAEDVKTLDRAYALAKKAHDNAPSDPYIADTLGWILYKRGECKLALPLLNDSAEKLPENAEVLYHFALVNLTLGNEAAASDALRRLLIGSQHFPQAAEAGRIFDALSTDPATAELEPTRARLIAALRMEPRNPLLLLRLGQLYARQGDKVEAQTRFKEALKVAPGFVPARVALANLLSDALNDPRQALAEARRAREDSPDNAEAAAALGWASLKQGDYTKAFSLLQEARQRLPPSPELLYRAAWSAYMVGRVTQAEEDMRRALQGPIEADRRKAAEQFLKMSDRKVPPRTDAVAAALKEDPGYLPALVANAREAEKRTSRDATEAYEDIVAQYPQFVPAFKSLLRLYAENGNGSNRAMEIGRKAHEFAPLDPAISKSYGIVAFCHRDYARAGQLLKESAKAIPRDGEVALYLGLCAKALKLPEEARTHLQLALQLQPNAPWAPRAREAMKDL